MAIKSWGINRFLWFPKKVLQRSISLGIAAIHQVKLTYYKELETLISCPIEEEPEVLSPDVTVHLRFSIQQQGEE
ncbi:hypothetical protein SYN63AY4M2_01770 [Synechococcus sp. 63AY4M2]|nr:hypothetical protein SYN63AY4M2_01770 [Synechococcus sp. 63AY4M2]PIL02349.1 hypothetical protein SYN65AY640_00960 [Synechococcus sp. 65AY640]